MSPEYPAQSFVQDMRGRVVPLYGRPALHVDRGKRPLPRLHLDLLLSTR